MPSSVACPTLRRAYYGKWAPWKSSRFTKNVRLLRVAPRVKRGARGAGRVPTLVDEIFGATRAAARAASCTAIPSLTGDAADPTGVVVPDLVRRQQRFVLGVRTARRSSITVEVGRRPIVRR